MRSNRGWNKCAYCGKFFSVKEFDEGKVKCNHTPDTSFSSEDESFFYHANCEIELFKSLGLEELLEPEEIVS